MGNKLNLRVFIALFMLPLFLMVGFIYKHEKIVAEDFNNEKNISNKLDNVISAVLPFSARLAQTGISFRYTTGESLQEGIFVSDKGLMKNLPPINEAIKTENSGTVLSFSRKLVEQDKAVYLAIIPSASGVLQQNLPKFSTTINQKNTIDNIYNQFAGEVLTINSYNILFENNEKYIYYRTEDAITPLGGYYIYNELVRRMLVSGEIEPITNFSVSYSNNKFYGSLYEKVPYKKISPDILAYYRNGDGSRYDVSYINNKGVYHYDDFYRLENRGLDSYLDGGGGIIKISNSQTSELELLILGDDSAISYLPFLAKHYSKITFVNIYDDSFAMSTGSTKDYDQVLITVDIENYTQTKIPKTRLDLFE